MELNRTVFITGSTGLLGLNVVESFLARGYRVRALARDAAKANRVLPNDPRVEVVVGDIEFAQPWIDRVDECDVVVHAAAYFREYFGRGDHDEKLTRLNVDFPVMLTCHALNNGVRRIIVVSSSGALRRPTDGHACRENDPIEGQLPHNGYQQSKVQMEHALSQLRLDPQRLVIVRPGWMWGPNDFAPTATGQIITDMIRTKNFQFVDGPAFGIVDARDVAEGISAIADLESPSPIYHLAGNNIRPLVAIKAIATQIGSTRVQNVPLGVAKALSAILEVVTRLLGRRNPLPREGIEVLATNFPIDSSLAERELHVRFRPFEETARDAVAFVRANGAAFVR